MKKIILLAIVFIGLQSCSKENSFVTLSGKIENLKKSDSVLTISNKDFKRDITLNSDGTFSDTLTIPKADYFTITINSKNSGFSFLRNGFDLKLNADNNSFIESVKFSGKGSSSSNYLISQFKFGKSIGDPRLMFELEKADFENKLKSLKSSFDSIKSNHKDIDTMLVRLNDKQNNGFFEFLEKNYDTQSANAKQAASSKKMLEKGKASPKFNNYANYKGGTSSLDSFKGKYVYIDVWATWCKPCLGEIPALKVLEKKYHKKNIQFISLSIDDERTAGSWENAKSKWGKMVKSKSLTGVQLFAGKDIQFIKDYQVSSIPRFILIDPKGNIVDANAQRPSDPNLEKTLNELGI